MRGMGELFVFENKMEWNCSKYIFVFVYDDSVIIF